MPESVKTEKLCGSENGSEREDKRMIPKKCKRLAEVDFPIAEVSKHSAREKSIRHGHPSTLHLWWARRPLAACRAMLLCLLWPDPCDPYCPEGFKQKARQLLPKVQGQIGPTDEDLQKALLRFIGDFANWDLATNKIYLEISRAMVKAAHRDEIPLVVDPFAGGGSIPLEALRIGCEAFASDLNPVSCLILKVMLEDIPRRGPELAAELRRVGAEIKQKAEKELAELYPKDPDGTTPIAYLWARTVRCEAPNCGAEIPVFRSPWLCKRGASRARYFKEDDSGDCVVVLIEHSPIGGPVKLRIARGHGSEDAQPGFYRISGTKVPGNNSNVQCPCCQAVLSGTKRNPRVQYQLTSQKGGSRVVFDENGNRINGARILAIASIKPGGKKRRYRLATDDDYKALLRAQKLLSFIQKGEDQHGISLVPNEGFHDTRPSPNSRGLSAVTRYGIHHFADLYNERQLVALAIMAKFVLRLTENKENSKILSNLLALCHSRVSDYCSAQSRWDPTQERNVNAFGRQALPMLWDYAELAPLMDCVGSWDSMLNGIIRVIEKTNVINSTGTVENADATDLPLPSDSTTCFFTDPPYYDSVPYADLADFFYVWLKRLHYDQTFMWNRFENSALTPKLKECVWNAAYIVNGKKKDPKFFEECITRAFREGRRVTREDGIGSIVFAHKTTKGWEALLSGLIQSGWSVVASWPIATEQRQRLIARETAALATSVHLVCRPRTDDAPVGDWADVLRELPKRVCDWMERLQSEGVRGADLVFACIGPALEIFSRYRRVETAEGREVKLAEYLAKVWEVVGRIALEQVLGTVDAKARNGAAGAVEEDARLTALFLWTLQSTNGETNVGEREGIENDTVEHDEEEEVASRGKVKGYSLVFDVVRRFAQPLGISLPKWEGRIIETKKGVVRLLSVAERAKILFGDNDAQSIAERLERIPAGDTAQLALFPEMDGVTTLKGKERGGRRKRTGVDLSDENIEAKGAGTTLDRVHVAMLLQASGRANALRALLKAEKDHGTDFLRLANALSALYPKGSEEKRLLDAMLLALLR